MSTELQKRCALQLETIRDLRTELESFKALCRKLNTLGNDTSDALDVALGEYAPKSVFEEESWRAGYEVGKRHAAGSFAADAHKQYEEELEVLFATHRREVAKLKLESDRRARNVAEAMRARCKALVAICDANMDDTNIEALVDESKL